MFSKEKPEKKIMHILQYLFAFIFSNAFNQITFQKPFPIISDFAF